MTYRGKDDVSASGQKIIDELVEAVRQDNLFDRMEPLVSSDVKQLVGEIERLCFKIVKLAKENKLLQAKLETATNIIKYAGRRGFEWPRDPMEAIEMTKTAP